MMERYRQEFRWLAHVIFMVALLTGATVGPLDGQLSLPTVVNLALRNSPRVKAAEADVEHARAGLAEARDAYIPSVIVGSGIGKTVGFPLGTPSIFNVNAQSLVFNYSQKDYIRSGRFGIQAAELLVADARLAVTADVALTYVALDRDLKREAALKDQCGYANRLIQIVQDRLSAGRDAPIDLTTVKLSAAQLKLASLRAADETAADRNHLAGLTGLPAAGLQVATEPLPKVIVADEVPAPVTTLSPAVASAYANARSKAEIAYGDARYVYRPQVSFGLQYSLFAIGFNNYNTFYPAGSLQANNAEIGVQISVPLLDRAHQARARGTAAEASRALHEADAARGQALDGQSKLRHAAAELRVREEVALLEQQLTQQQLDIVLVQLKNSATGNNPQLTPKDEQTSRIAEREKYLAVLDATFQLQQAEINLLRETGGLDAWLGTMAQGVSPQKP